MKKVLEKVERYLNKEEKTLWKEIYHPDDVEKTFSALNSAIEKAILEAEALYKEISEFIKRIEKELKL